MQDAVQHLSTDAISGALVPSAALPAIADSAAPLRSTFENGKALDLTTPVTRCFSSSSFALVHEADMPASFKPGVMPAYEIQGCQGLVTHRIKGFSPLKWLPTATIVPPSLPWSTTTLAQAAVLRIKGLLCLQSRYMCCGTDLIA